MPVSRAAFPLPPPPPAPGLLVRSLGAFWGIADGLWAVPGLVARTLADLPSAARRLPEALLDLGVSALLLGFRRPAATLSLVLLVTGGPIAAAAAAPLFRDLEGTASTGPSRESAPKPAPNRDLARRPAPPAPPAPGSPACARWCGWPGAPRAAAAAGSSQTAAPRPLQIAWAGRQSWPTECTAAGRPAATPAGTGQGRQERGRAVNNR